MHNASHPTCGNEFLASISAAAAHNHNSICGGAGGGGELLKNKNSGNRDRDSTGRGGKVRHELLPKSPADKINIIRLAAP